jgi:hypothetical protein
MSTVPGVINNFIVQQGNSVVALSWDFYPGATSYIIQRSVDNSTFSTVGTVTTNSYTDSTVTVNTQYFYKVAAVNSGGTGIFTNSISVIPTPIDTASLGWLRTAAQQRADRVGSNFVTKDEWNSYINQSALELYDILVTEYEDYFIGNPYQFTTDGSTNRYTLPADFYKLAGVDCGLANSNNAWVTLKKFQFAGRNRYVFPNINATYFGVFNLQYRIVGNQLMFIPTPSAGQFVRMWYVPRLPTMLLDTDSIDTVSGWSEYIIVDAAIKALQKEESDVSVLQGQKMALIKRIEEAAMNRDEGMPDTVSDSRTQSYRWGGSDGGSWGGF